MGAFERTHEKLVDGQLTAMRTVQAIGDGQSLFVADYCEKISANHTKKNDYFS
jgi:hypothetical protein